MLDAVHGVNTGIVRALHKQFLASIATLCCYYIFGMPLALLLGFKYEFGVKGFWLGFTFALVLQDVIVTIIILCANWNIGAELASDRVADEEKQELVENEKIKVSDNDDEFFDSEKAQKLEKVQ